jgi:hypothetical protein
MIQDNDKPQEQSAQEETEPVSPNHNDLEASEAEAISGGGYTTTSTGTHPN